MTDVLLVRVNCPSAAVADEIAEAAIASGLAVCANIDGPIRSVYVWESEIERAEEWVLWLKSAAKIWDRLEALVLAHHPHEVPAILGVPCEAAYGPFAAWIETNLSSDLD